MKSNFNKCCDLLLKDEGGYSNDPNDNGGATNLGITLVDYRKHINSRGTPNDVKNLTVAQARAIYKTKYWDALDCDNLPSGVDYTCFDYGVNSGLGRPRKALDKFKTLQGDKLIDAINDERMAFLRAIGKGHNAGFLNGWTHRVTRVRGYSHVLSTNKDTSTGAITGAGTLGVFATLSQYFHQHQTAIIIGGLVAAVIIGTIVHMVRNRK